MQVRKEKNKKLATLMTLCLAIFVGLGFDTQMSLYLKPISDDLGFLRNQVVLLISVKMLVMTFSALAMPKLIGKLGAKKVMIMGALVLGISWSSYGVFDSLALMYTAAFIGGFGTMSVIFSLPQIIKRTVTPEKVGTTTGIIYSFSGIAGAVLTPITMQLIRNVGWKTSFILSGTLVLVLSLIPFILFLKPRYDNVIIATDEKKNNSTGKEKVNTTYRMRIPLLILVSFTASYTLSVMFHVPVYMQEQNFSLDFVTLIVTVYSIFLVVAKPLYGILVDKFGLKQITLSAALGNILFVIVLSMMTTAIHAYAYAVLFGLAAALPSVGLALLAINVVPEEKYQKVWSIIMMLQSLGVAIGAWVNGYLFDLTGSYQLAFIICGLMAFITIASATTIKADTVKEQSIEDLRRRNYEESI